MLASFQDRLSNREVCVWDCQVHNHIDIRGLQKVLHRVCPYVELCRFGARIVHVHVRHSDHVKRFENRG